MKYLSFLFLELWRGSVLRHRHALNPDSSPTDLVSTDEYN